MDVYPAAPSVISVMASKSVQSISEMLQNRLVASPATSNAVETHAADGITTFIVPATAVVTASTVSAIASSYSDNSFVVGSPKKVANAFVLSFAGSVVGKVQN